MKIKNNFVLLKCAFIRAFRFFFVVTLIFISNTLLSQIVYPRLVMDGGDTLVIQTLEQTRWVSKQLEIGKSCELSGVKKDSIINRMNINEKHLYDIITLKNETIASKDSTIADKELIIDSHKKINNELVKENKNLKIKNTLILIGGSIITTIIILF